MVSFAMNAMLGIAMSPLLGARAQAVEAQATRAATARVAVIGAGAAVSLPPPCNGCLRLWRPRAAPQGAPVQSSAVRGECLVLPAMTPRRQGLSAARTLVDNWPEVDAGGAPTQALELVIIEARNRAGGRVWTPSNNVAGDPWRTGSETELGCPWISSPGPSNPLSKMAEVLGLDWTEADPAFTSLHVCVPADDASAQCAPESFSSVSSVLAELVAAAKSRASEKQEDDSLLGTLDEASSRLDSGGVSAGVRALLAARDELQFGAPASTLSAQLWAESEEVGDDGASVSTSECERV